MFTFGTYHITDIAGALGNVFQCSQIRSIDTAPLYKNEGKIGDYLEKYLMKNDNAKVLVTTKLWDTKMRNMDIIIRCVKDSVAKLVQSFKERIVIRVLLHHPALPHVWKALEECLKMGIIDEIGVSNHDIQALQDLFRYATIRPCVNQLEVHPFLDPHELQPLLKFCRDEGIPVQAHTALMRGLYWSHDAIVTAAQKHELTQPQFLVAWAASQIGVENVCIATINNVHLQELLASPIPNEPMESVNVPYHRLYPFHKVDKTHLPDLDWSFDALAETLKNDLTALTNGHSVTNLPIMIPSVRSKRTDFSREIAKRVYPNDDDHAAQSRFAAMTKPLRIHCEERHNKRAREERKQTLCCVTKKVKQFDDQISETILNPTPMPVDIAEAETLKPFLYYLSSDEEFAGDKEFFKGAVIDKRMDMCKQVTGPDHIEALCDAVSKNTQVRHFLLGNNIAFRGDQKKAHAIGNIMKSNQPIETWYLAGNYIGPEAIEIMCQGLMGNTVCKSLWLKRNPLGSQGALSLRTLMYYNQTLTLLDLDNCGLLDIGVQILFSDVNGEIDKFCLSSLQHIYLDSDGITPVGAAAIAKWCRKHKHSLKSIYLSINRMGDEGARMICDALKGSLSLKRFVMGSNRLTDNVAEEMVDFALSCEKLITFDLGCYKSTFDMGEKPNFFTQVKPFVRLVRNHPKLKYLDLFMNNIPVKDALELVEVVRTEKPEMSIVASQISTKPQERKKFSWNVDASALKFVKHPKKVLHIDSIYRNRM